MRFFRLEGPDVWGDFGGVLIGGQASDRCRQDGLLLLDRTGPFVPPITLPFDVVVVTTEFCQKLQEAFPGLQFRQVIKDHIVELHWETWDRNVFPQERPPGNGEPEDYLYSNPHSPETAEEMGDLWELVLRVGAESRLIDRGSGFLQLQILSPSWTGEDVFQTMPSRIAQIVVSERAKQWLEHEVTDWVSFDEAEVVAE